MKEQFSGVSTDDAAAHLNNFVELCEMQKYKDVDGDIIKLKLFTFSLRGRAKDWLLSLPRNSIDSWVKCKDAFIGKYYPSAKIIALQSDKIDTIMAMLVNDRGHVDPNNVPLTSLVAQEEKVDVNLIRNNNFNNSAYRDNFASNNYRSYPSNSDNGYLGRPKMPSEERILEVERATKNFMQMQYEQNKLFTKTMEEQSALLKTISHQLDNSNRDIPKLQAKVSKAETSISFLSDAQSSLINRMAAQPNPFAATNAIQVRIDENVRMLAELHARWEREDEMARNMNIFFSAINQKRKLSF
jgi:hypothetical protein